MYSTFQLAGKYLHYYMNASNSKGHGMHSPFVFKLITKVFNDRQHYPDYDKVEVLRRQLLQDQNLLQVEDLGAGSSISKTNSRTVASIAKNAAKPKKFGQLLYRMAKYYQPKTILELGTSLGISTSYLSLGNPEATITSIEGAKEVEAVAKRNFQQLELKNIQTHLGNFDNVLPEMLKVRPFPDLIFIDGNHRREPTERYFEQCVTVAGNDSIMIFDDIHWSREMEEAWGTIKKHPSVRCTVDLFFIGLVFFRQEFKEKQHFRIRF